MTMTITELAGATTTEARAAIGVLDRSLGKILDTPLSSRAFSAIVKTITMGRSCAPSR